jgi:hypothetical protein
MHGGVSLGHPYEAKDTVTLFIGHNTLLFSGGGLVNCEWVCLVNFVISSAASPVSHTPRMRFVGLSHLPGERSPIQ